MGIRTKSRAVIPLALRNAAVWGDFSISAAFSMFGTSVSSTFFISAAIAGSALAATLQLLSNRGVVVYFIHAENVVMDRSLIRIGRIARVLSRLARKIEK